MGSEARDAMLRPAGFWRRVIAVLVDLGVVWLLLSIGALVAAPLGRYELVARAFHRAYVLVIPAAYVVLMHGTGGQTLGKVLAGVRVVTVAGEPVGYPRALARYLAWFLSALPGMLGHLMVAVRRDKRALHDLVAGTRVVRVR
ncbi:MAG: RDD family protein [Candidatus Rokubacteria bacterium]|nr:RDD family protein [Candidatus Rokubacteria bacterium]